MSAKRRRIVAEDLDLGYAATVIPTDTGGSRAANKVSITTFMGGVYSVDTDAAGDGVTDDTQAIQAVLDRAAEDPVSTTGCGTVLFGNKKYKISAPLTITSKIGMVIRGVGMRGTRIQPTIALAGLSMFKFTDCREVIVADMWIEGNSSGAPGAAIEFTTAATPVVVSTHNTVRNCLIGAASASSLVKGIKWTASSNTNNDVSVIESVELVNCSTAALSIEHSQSLNHRFNNLSIDLTNESSASAVLLAGGSFTMWGGQMSIPSGGWDVDFATGTYQYPTRLIGTSSESSGGIIRAAASNNIWVNFIGYHRQGATASATPINFDSANGRFFAHGCIFDLGQTNTWDFSGATAYAAFIGCSLNPTVVTWENDLVWLGNHINTGTVTLTPGSSAKILELGSSNTEMEVGYLRGLQRIASSASVAAGSSEASFSAQKFELDNRLTQSEGASVVAATTITLGNDGNCFVISGATTIDNITSTNWPTGSIITLLFASTPDVRHNQVSTGTGILLAGATTFSATANDSLTLRLMTSPTEGGIRWMEIARTVI